ncbi:hypothetical protein NDI45_08500 [Leptolyngbya sp. GB1-A1]|uniref:hypothetical protein n=1 Tax=Leptolyngbya sp. GB1-A1 TaxID=2933908 RepID=UPI00329729F4
MAIESKKVAFSMEAGFAQLLAYRLANPQRKTPLFGMIATGSPFAFVKLVQEECLKYAIADQFGISNRVKGLYDVFRIMKRIGNLLAHTGTSLIGT